MSHYIITVSNKTTLPLLAENIKNYRTELGLSQAALGEKLGYSQQIIFAYENGSRVPPPATLAKMADMFKTSIDILVGKRRAKPAPWRQSRILRRLSIVEKLPLEAQKNVLSLVENIAKAHNIKAEVV
jgi:transcriptional regulator with XRE-family HTH domain